MRDCRPQQRSAASAVMSFCVAIWARWAIWGLCVFSATPHGAISEGEGSASPVTAWLRPGCEVRYETRYDPQRRTYAKPSNPRTPSPYKTRKSGVGPDGLV